MLAIKVLKEISDAHEDFEFDVVKSNEEDREINNSETMYLINKL